MDQNSILKNPLSNKCVFVHIAQIWQVFQSCFIFPHFKTREIELIYPRSWIWTKKNPSFSKSFLTLPMFLHLLRQFDKFFQFFIIFIFRLPSGPVCRNKKYLSIPDLDFGRKKSLFGSDLYRCWMHLPFNWHCFSDHSPQIWTTVSTLLGQALTFLYVAF